MIRDSFLTIRTNMVERQLAADLAERLERNGSDLVRLLLREKAREMGILPATPKEEPSAVQAAGAI